MGNKKYYVILFLTLVLTIFVLGLSYCQTNDSKISYNSNEETIADARIIYSNRNIIDRQSNETDLSIVNTSKESQTYLITFANLKDNNNPIYINSIETDPKEAYVVKLDALGTKNDQITLNIVGSKNDAYKINVAKEEIIEVIEELPEEVDYES